MCHLTTLLPHPSNTNYYNFYNTIISTIWQIIRITHLIPGIAVDTTVLSIIFGPTFLYLNTSIHFTLMMQKTALKVTTKSLYLLGHFLMPLQAKTDTQPKPNAEPLITKQ